MRRALTIGAFLHDLVRVMWPCLSSYSDESSTGHRSGDTITTQCTVNALGSRSMCGSAGKPLR